MGDQMGDILAEAKDINGVKLITKQFDDLTINDLRTLSDDIKASNKSVIMVFAAVNGGKVTFMVSITDDLLDKYHAGNMIKKIAAAAGGGGGGKADEAYPAAKRRSAPRRPAPAPAAAPPDSRCCERRHCGTPWQAVRGVLHGC